MSFYRERIFFSLLIARLRSRVCPLAARAQHETRSRPQALRLERGAAPAGRTSHVPATTGGDHRGQWRVDDGFQRRVSHGRRRLLPSVHAARRLQSLRAAMLRWPATRTMRRVAVSRARLPTMGCRSAFAAITARRLRARRPRGCRGSASGGSSWASRPSASPPAIPSRTDPTNNFRRS